MTYNMGVGGATIDASIVPGTPNAVSMKSQIENQYLPIYASRPSFAPWAAGNTLFAFFIGINDIGKSRSFPDAEAAGDIEKEWTEYSALIDKMYTSGARNFLFLNVPPIDRSPEIRGEGEAAVAKEKARIETWNKRLSAFVTNFSKTRREFTAFVVDTNAVFSRVLDSPDSYPQTAGLKNLTDYCYGYAEYAPSITHTKQNLLTIGSGTEARNTYMPTCASPVNEYFWLNALHPTFPVHNATASQIAKDLGGSGYPRGQSWRSGGGNKKVFIGISRPS